MQQLSLLEDTVEPEEVSTEELFAPNGHRRCEHCRRPLTAWGGLLYCLSIGCPAGVAS